MKSSWLKNLGLKTPGLRCPSTIIKANNLGFIFLFPKILPTFHHSNQSFGYVLPYLYLFYFWKVCTQHAYNTCATHLRRQAVEFVGFIQLNLLFKMFLVRLYIRYVYSYSSERQACFNFFHRSWQAQKLCLYVLPKFKPFYIRICYHVKPNYSKKQYSSSSLLA